MQGVHDGNLALTRHVDTDDLPGEQTALDIAIPFLRLIEEEVAEHRVRDRGRLAEEAVGKVGREALLVGAVGIDVADRVDETLVKVDLAGVGGDVVLEGAVRQGVGVIRVVCHDVNVRRAAAVVAGKDGAEPDGAVGVCRRDAAAERGLAVRWVEGVGDARIDARGVRVPNLDILSLDRLACLGINDLEVQVHQNALLPVLQVPTQLLALDIYFCQQGPRNGGPGRHPQKGPSVDSGVSTHPSSRVAKISRSVDFQLTVLFS